MTRRLRLQVRDHTLALRCAVSGHREADVIARHLALGAWRVLLPEDSEAGHLFRQPGSGLVADLDGVRLLSGPTVLIRRTRVGRGVRMVEVSGVDDTALAWRREAWPKPTAALSAQTDAYDVRTGPGETVLKGYIRANAGDLAEAQRRVPGLVIAPTSTPARGAIVTGRARFDRLAELCNSLANASGLGWGVVQQARQLVADVYTPQDRTHHAQFSVDLRNLDEYTLEEGWPEVTRAIVAGGGEGTARVFRDVSDTAAAAAWHTYAETFVDQRQTSDPAELDQAGREALAQGAGRLAFGGIVRDTDACRWGEAWNLGDRATVYVGGQAYRDVIREVVVEDRPKGCTLRPVIGAPDATDPRYAPVVAFFRRLRAAEARAAALERST